MSPPIFDRASLGRPARNSATYSLAVLGWLILSPLSCCPATTSQPPDTAGGTTDKTHTELTLLFTSDEHGWMEPSGNGQAPRGGLMQLLDQLVQDEGHCAGAWPGEPEPDCSGAHTLLLSGGDNYTGPALSSFFRGKTTADALRRLGYAASAFGNHELDFGHDAYFFNQQRAGLQYLAANISGSQPNIAKLTKPYLIIERAGARVGVIGVATPETPKTAAPHRFRGLVFEDIEATLDRVVPQVWAEDVDALVVVAHECPQHLREPVERHPEWALSFVGGGHCHKLYDEKVGQVPLVAPDWRASRYARVRLRIDKEKPLKQRAALLSHRVVEVKPRTDPAERDEPFARRVKIWRWKLEGTLGEQIGYTQTGLGQTSAELRRWILRAWRADTGADIAVTTQGGIRQALPAGSITRESVLSILPFENELVICELPGSALPALFEHKSAHIEGVMRDEKGALVLSDGKPIDPARRYRIVTTDFLYAGGDHMPFAKHDKAPQYTGKSWRDPVTAWALKHRSSEAKPIETMLGPK